jgi:flagellar biosynthesis protein FlhA
MLNSAATEQDGLLARALQQSDIMLAVGIIMLIGMMLIPLPTPLLDVLLTLNIALSLSILLVAMYVGRPLDFSVFPSLLLVATLYRLALNVSSTRLILLNASAGKVIEAFGHFVVGGDLVVGMIIFLILVVIQFVVITSGSQRVAEVAARFTLDEMPGKQMSVDADLNAGIIDEREARRRRREIEREADFYGAMDGAAKFVRGDAIAGVIIVGVNLLGGLVIGVVRLKLPVAEAVQRYCLLTVGDGLVSQIPALLLSTATGLVVTRAASESNLGHEVTRQLVSQPRAVMIVAAMLLAMGLVPGLPKLSFLMTGVLAGVVGWILMRRQEEEATGLEEERVETTAQPHLPAAQHSEVDELLAVDRLALGVGYGLLPLMDRSRPGNVPDRLTALRRQLAAELGLIIPAVHIFDDLDLRPNAYVIRMKEQAVGQGEARPTKLLAISSQPNPPSLPGEVVKEPAFGLPAVWIDEGVRHLAEARGFTVVDAATVVVTHFAEVVKDHAAELLSRQDVQMLLDRLREREPAVVNELVPDLASVGTIQQVLRRLLQEKVPIRDLSGILEAMADALRRTDKLEEVVELVRLALAPVICTRLAGVPVGSQHLNVASQERTLHVIVVDPELERLLITNIVETAQGSVCALDEETARELLRAVGEQLERANALKASTSGAWEVALLASPRARRHLWSTVHRSFPKLAVISYMEIATGFNVEVVGELRINLATAPDTGGGIPRGDTGHTPPGSGKDSDSFLIGPPDGPTVPRAA